MVDYTLVKIKKIMNNLIEALKHDLSVVVSVVMLAVGLIIGTVTSRLNVGNRLTKLEEHAKDEDKHWTTEKKYTVFMPRVEVENRFLNMERILERIEKKLDK